MSQRPTPETGISQVHGLNALPFPSLPSNLHDDWGAHMATQRYCAAHPIQHEDAVKVEGERLSGPTFTR